ncbi:unnamed protein product [Didymodactylos carnosus]|uniref:Mothers against decapentaplegic homolog n=1 Tax=Didymodactylos carnosus TaxID=1234261 RepID=A0A813TIP2_9BILA|nr:unnamed protein product [Didymodactylos carnosus]CAF0908930.1 unnamed protein product [Didymodactylos carnosus]CAF3595498.1 unnamed protein product [Didymodactylos carnosus]CAF3688263.1 unnamed protein product [Didymodactylos carnosus]
MSNSPFPALPHVLMGKIVSWKHSNEECNHGEKAVEFLIKKLKSKKGVLDDLANILIDPNQPISKCITIPNSSDKRIQIGYKKYFPHVLYCRLWRWADLQNHHELKAKDYCQYSFSQSKTDVCINPYHYDRIYSTVLPSIIIPRMDENFSTYQELPYDHSIVNNYYPQECDSLNSIQNVYPVQVQYDDQTLSSSYSSCIQKWCTLAYYEYFDRVGEKYNVTTPFVYVDGYTSPLNTYPNRFSLGVISNVQRRSEVKKVRSIIKDGIELSQTCFGDVYVRNLSYTSSIYVRSILYNRLNGFRDTTVCKILPNSRSNIVLNNQLLFKYDYFKQLLIQSMPLSYDYVNELSKLCSIRLSFVKGWGSDYAQSDITSTPCWLEIQLNKPLLEIDHILQQIEPQGFITSFS